MAYEWTFDATGSVTAPDALLTPAEASAAPGGDNEIAFTITALPNDNGGPITRVERQIDNGTWEDLNIDVSAAFPQTVNVSGIAAGVRTPKVRAVNSAGSGAETTLATVTVTGSSTATTSIAIVHRSNDETGPEGISFGVTPVNFPGVANPTGIYDERIHKTASVWSFPTLGSSYRYLQRTIGESGNPQHAVGAMATRTFPAGAHTAQVTTIAWFNGNLTIATSPVLNFTVGTPDYSGDKTIFVGDEANAISAGITGAVVVSTFEAAVTAAAGRIVPMRIMLDGTTLSTSPVNFGSTHPSILIDGLSGAKLLWDGTGNGEMIGFNNYDSGKNKDFKLGEIFLEGLWDVTTETGPLIDGIATRNGLNEPGYVHLYGTQFEKLGIPIRPNSWSQDNPTTTSSEDIWMIHDTRVSRWRSMATLASTGYIYGTGNRWAQDINGLSGGPRTNGNQPVPHNDHTARVANCKILIWTDFDLTSHNGWFINWRDQFGNDIFTRQPGFRAHTTPYEGSLTIMNHGVSEGSITALPANRNLPLGSRNMQISHIVSLNDVTNGRFWSFAGGGISIYACLLVWPAYNPTGGLFQNSAGTPKPDRSMLMMDPEFNITAQSLADPVNINGNTFLHLNGEDLINGNIGNGALEISGYSNVNTDGNLYLVGTAPDLSNLTIEDLFAWEDTTDYDAFNLPGPIGGTATPANTATMVTPTASHPLADSVTGEPVSPYDILMNQRAVPDTPGARIAV